MSRQREIVDITTGMPASDGAGVNMTRIIGTPMLDHIDPFLLFDVFESDNPDDYIAGFPPHPHRGFETVTYMLAGQMRHRDNAGNEGVIRAGGVQWMTAGRGIVHSEMPEQQDGLMWGTQLWVNLPREHKMTAPAYQEIAADGIPVDKRALGVEVRVIAGRSGAVTDRPTEPIYLDVQMPAKAEFEETIPDTHSAFLFVIEGTLRVSGQDIDSRTLAILGDGDSITVESAETACRFLLIAGRKLDEPIARAGPFVMNTQSEIRQAISDFQSGRF
ncbi:MAG: pirin family protein [Woeseiaceae bacterium]|nr:pirin family protein [Woeseiaceae bacterium]